MGYGFYKGKMYEQAEKVFDSMPGFLNSDRYGALTKEKRIETAELGKVISFGQYRWKVIGRDKANHIVTMIASDVGPSHPFYQVPFNETQEPAFLYHETPLLVAVTCKYAIPRHEAIF